MSSVSLSRTLAGTPDRVRELVSDVGPFMRGAGFDEVEVDGETVVIRNSVGLATIELTCEVVDRDCILAYEQRDGIFESMETEYHLEEVAEGTEITATTTFAVDVALVGEILDATVIKRQRRKELTAQFDYLETQLAPAA